jgi:uncharacterized membrane protein YeaQ/YmgE (transglycosylase-associated protein family)
MQNSGGFIMCSLRLRLLHAAPLSFVVTPALAQTASADVVSAGAGLIIGFVVATVVGAIIGWIAGLIVTGSGSGLFGNLFYGIGGLVLANLVLRPLGISFETDWFGPLIAAVIGAVVLILIVRLIRRATA